MADIDSSFTFSSVVKLSSRSTNGLSIAIYPNPVGNTINLQLQNSRADKFALKLFDAAGKEYLSQLIQYQPVTHSCQYRLPTLHTARTR